MHYFGRLSRLSLSSLFVLIPLFVLLTLFVLIPGVALAAIPVEVDGIAVQFSDQQPYVDSNYRTMVPLRDVLEQMGAVVTWDGLMQAAVITKDGTTVVFTVDDDEYVVDGEVMSMDTVPAAVNGRVCLPIRYAAEALGAFVRWNGARQVVEIWVNEIPPVMEEPPVEEGPPLDTEPDEEGPVVIEEPAMEADASYDYTINAANVDELRAAVEAANLQGSTRILLADGDYALDDTLYINAPGICVEGASGHREAVVLHGPCFQIFGVSAADFHLRNLSAGNVETHAVQIHGELDADRPVFENVRFFDTGEQMLKVSYEEGNPAGSDYGRVENCLFEYTAGIGPQWYIGGVDAHQAQGWIIRGNRFVDIRSPEEDLAEYAVHFWSGSSDTIVEKNIIVDCDRGIGFGLGERGHDGGRISNNMIYTSRDVGIGLESASGALVYNNTLWTENYDNSIEYRFAASNNIEIINNLCNGLIAERDGASAEVESNLEGAHSEWFVNSSAGDLHLASSVAEIVDQGSSIDVIGDDIDDTSRPQGSSYDLGAQEWR